MEINTKSYDPIPRTLPITLFQQLSCLGNNSGKRGVITQSNGKGCLDEREDVIIGSKYRGGEWDDANTASPGIASRVLGRFGFPASSFQAEIFAAHRTVAMLMKRASFAICRPTQILSSDLNPLNYWECTGSCIPWSEAMKKKI